VRIVAKKNNEKTAQQNKERSSGRVRDLEFKGTAYKLTAVPETAGGFHSEDVHATSNQAHDPTHYVVHSVKIHIKCWFKRMGKYMFLVLSF
jgi:hypothetical protein